jgi:hypothetical protein
MTEANNTKQCPKEDIILDYHYGELSLDESGNVGSHLESCSRCSGILSQFRSLADAFSSVREGLAHFPVSVPPRRSSWRSRFRSRVASLQWSPALASSLAAIALFIILIFTLSETGDRSTSTQIVTKETPPASNVISPDEIGKGDEAVNTDGDLASAGKPANPYEGLRLANFDPEPDEGIRLSDMLNEVEEQ